MLRDTACAGFTLELDDGRRVEVPAGPIEVAMEGARLEPLSTDEWRALLAWLRAAPSPEPRPVIPHDDVIACRIADGDRVELWAELAPGDAPYRGTPNLHARPPIRVRQNRSS
jgi:hypothetical protein